MHNPWSRMQEYRATQRQRLVIKKIWHQCTLRPYSPIDGLPIAIGNLELYSATRSSVIAFV